MSRRRWQRSHITCNDIEVRTALPDSNLKFPNLEDTELAVPPCDVTKGELEQLS